ncbi:uncharacterized protein LOC135467033 [Liolophura sinensis]|uniref:uncharacterized protein LOC135467033 n=1 Tax=Liolophura sinensis TaxID=3198878 RepID=UPI0031594DDB
MSETMATLPPRQPRLTAAREIVEYPESVSGWLRRLGKVERILSPVVLKLLKIKWRQRFIVLADGYLYMFKDETSSTPLHSSCLVGYFAVVRAMNDPEVSMVPWCFKLEPHESSKIHYFACTCQKDMEKWMWRFKREIMKAHKMPISSTDRFESGDYIFLEAPIMSQGQTEMPMTGLQRGPASLSDSNGYDTDDMDEDYFEIDDNSRDKSVGARSLPLPEIPKPSHPRCQKANPKGKHHKETNGPTARSPISYNPRGVRETKEASSGSFMFDSSDKKAAARLLEKAKKPGIYLVRPSRRCENQEVLAVSTAYGVKEYQIFNVDNKKSLDKCAQFDTVEELVTFYRRNNLPTHPIKLSQSYSLVDLTAE